MGKSFPKSERGIQTPPELAPKLRLLQKAGNLAGTDKDDGTWRYQVRGGEAATASSYLCPKSGGMSSARWTGESEAVDL